MIIPLYYVNGSVVCIMLGTMLVPQLYALNIVPQAQETMV